MAMASMEDELERLQAENNSMQDELKGLKTENSSMEDELERLQAENNSLKTETASMLVKLKETSNNMDRVVEAKNVEINAVREMIRHVRGQDRLIGGQTLRGI